MNEESSSTMMEGKFFVHPFIINIEKDIRHRTLLIRFLFLSLMEKTENEWAGGMPIEPKIMDGFDTWGYGGSSGNFQGTFRHLL